MYSIVVNELILTFDNQEASEYFARQLASVIKPPLTLAFSGDLGAGKTTIIRAMLRALGITSAIKSPTFSLVESYECHAMWVHHFDLYRIAHEEELEYLGFRDYFNSESVCCIEWAENASQALLKADIRFKLKNSGSDGRVMHMSAFTEVGTQILAHLTGA